jgi:hypothetical protein
MLPFILAAVGGYLIGDSFSIDIYEDGGTLPKLKNEEIEFLRYFPMKGMLRKLMGKDEIKISNTLVKKGLLSKGTADDGGGRMFFLDMTSKQMNEIDYIKN